MAKLPRHSAVSQQIGPDEVVIGVGPQLTRYRVQKAFLTHYSEYFEAMLRGPWKEARSKTIELPEIEIVVFNLFIEWLYTGIIPAYNDIEEWNEIAGCSENEDHLMLVLKLYVFADSFMVPNLRDQVNRYIARCNLHTPDDKHIIYAFDNLPSTDPILDFFVDTCYTELIIEPRDFEAKTKALSHMPHDFLLRFVVNVGKHRPIGDFSSARYYMNEESYYIHGARPGKIRSPEARQDDWRGKIVIQWEPFGLDAEQDADIGNKNEDD